MLSWQNIWNSRQITAVKRRIKEELGNQQDAPRGGGTSLIYLPFLIEQMETMPQSYQQNGISERHWKSTFDFTEIVNNALKRGTVFKLSNLFRTFL